MLKVLFVPNGKIARYTAPGALGKFLRPAIRFALGIAHVAIGIDEPGVAKVYLPENGDRGSGPGHIQGYTPDTVSPW